MAQSVSSICTGPVALIAVYIMRLAHRKAHQAAWIRPASASKR
jgi:hypothetical protein